MASHDDVAPSEPETPPPTRSVETAKEPAELADARSNGAKFSRTFGREGAFDRGDMTTIPRATTRPTKKVVTALGKVGSAQYPAGPVNGSGQRGCPSTCVLFRTHLRRSFPLAPSHGIGISHAEGAKSVRAPHRGSSVRRVRPRLCDPGGHKGPSNPVGRCSRAGRTGTALRRCVWRSNC